MRRAVDVYPFGRRCGFVPSRFFSFFSGRGRDNGIGRFGAEALVGYDEVVLFFFFLFFFFPPLFLPDIAQIYGGRAGVHSGRGRWGGSILLFLSPFV